MACRVCPRATAERIRMCAKVDDARDVTETVAFVLTRRKQHAPEEACDQPCGRQQAPARADT
eukprot:3604438-Pleurochrysis_carterae.AAC.1